MMRLKKWSRGFAAVVAAGTLALVPSLPVYADETPTPSASAWAEIQRNLDFFEVPAAQQQTIRGKFEAGEVLDAFTGASPVSTDVLLKGDSKWTVERFADGSYDATSIQGQGVEGRADPRTRGIGGCGYSYSTGVATYSNCRAQKNMLYLDMSFTLTYSQYSGGSSIGSVGNWDIQAVGASCSKAEFGIVAARGYSSASPAVARLKASCTAIAGIASGTPYIEASIAPTSASLSANR